jgi:hypothetical protein
MGRCGAVGKGGDDDGMQGLHCNVLQRKWGGQREERRDETVIARDFVGAPP